MKKIFYNISGAIRSNNISGLLILFNYFQNMYLCDRRLSETNFFTQKITR